LEKQKPYNSKNGEASGNEDGNRLVDIETID